MFIEIVKGNKILHVPAKAYESQYKVSGWVLANENKMNDSGESWNTEALSNVNTNESNKSVPDEPELTQDETWDDDWEEENEEVKATPKSYDEMDTNELIEVAKSKGLDTDKFKTVGELKKALKKM